MAQDQKTGGKPGPAFPKKRDSGVISKNIYWHTAFYEAMQLELEDYKEVLIFKPEYHLTEEPLRIDTLIIKKPPDITIGKNFGQMFRGENIVEFKSPDDYLSVKDFYKVYAYACLYAAITPDVDISDITLTFIETRYPRELIKHLREVRGYTIEEPWSGIHRVLGDILPIQLLESKKLSESDNIWLKGLNKGLDLRSTNIILEKSGQRGKDTSIWAYLEVFLRANSLAFEEVHKMVRGYPTLEEVFTRAGLLPKWLEKRWEEGREQGREEIAGKLKAYGDPVEKIVSVTGLSPEEIEKL